MNSKKKSSSSPPTHSQPFVTFKSNVNVQAKGDRENKVSVKPHMIGRVNRSMLNWSLKEELEK